MANKKPEKLTCSNLACGKELHGNDKLYVDAEGCTFCSKHCLLESNLQEETTVKDYIDGMEPWEWII